MTVSSKYYIDIPNLGFQFLQPNLNATEYLPEVVTHNWVETQTNNFFTDEAISWFNHIGFDIKHTLYLFCANSQVIGPIHSDLTNYAFNFVVSGYGKMEWIKPHNKPYTDEKVYGNRVSKYLRFEPHNEDMVIDSWVGTQALVQVFTPHRIVTSHEKRYTVSLRTHGKKIQSWEQAVSNLQQYINSPL